MIIAVMFLLRHPFQHLMGPYSHDLKRAKQATSQARRPGHPLLPRDGRVRRRRLRQPAPVAGNVRETEGASNQRTHRVV